jgi:hypothetical protein
MKKIRQFLLAIIISLALTSDANAGSTQNNTSGSNTAIEGGYTSSTTYQSGSSSSSTTTNNSTSNIRSAPPSAFAPGVNSSGVDVCSVGASAGVQTFGLGVSGGKTFRDENLCQDPRVFEAMVQAGTPCPFEGKIGKQANTLWKKYDKLRPDYRQYTKNLKIMEKIDEETIVIKPLPSIKSKSK